VRLWAENRLAMRHSSSATFVKSFSESTRVGLSSVVVLASRNHKSAEAVTSENPDHWPKLPSETQTQDGLMIEVIRQLMKLLLNRMFSIGQDKWVAMKRDLAHRSKLGPHYA
jgi:hypothetical protein